MFTFHSDANPSKELCERVASLSPRNPFYTAAFVAARCAAGAQPWVLSLSANGELMTGCTAFMSAGRLTCRVEIPSLPNLPQGDAFWEGLREFCAQNKVTELLVNSFGSEAAAIPSIATEVWRRPRREFILDLADETHRKLSSNHKRNVTRAEKAGFVVRQAANFEACREHARLVAASTKRREDRGEKSSDPVKPETFYLLTDTGAGTIHQAVFTGSVLSSVLVLIAARAGYYHSAGTTAEGMGLGASHFLVHRIAEGLRELGSEQFNLGGSGVEETGLSRFKMGFGATAVELEAARFFTGGRIKRALMVAARVLRGEGLG